MSKEYKNNRALMRELSMIQYALGTTLTEEQEEFVSDFTRNTISFSDAGTGKTHSLIAGIALAQKHYGVKGSRICCMSFTNAAVNEMSGRYDKLRKNYSVGSKPKFTTIHSLFYSILRDAFPEFRVVNEDFTRDKPLIEEYMKACGLDSANWRLAKNIYHSIKTLNSSLVFDKESLENNYEYKKLNISFDQFSSIRRHYFGAGRIMERISQGEIPLYCLWAMHKNPDVIDKWKGKYDIMIIDEFQDLSILQLELLSYISNTMVVIGDMKQQIYEFNGSSDLIVDKFMKDNEDVIVCNLTKSFRCKDTIVEFAKRVVEPNMINEELKFKGASSGGSVEIIQRSNLDWKGIAKSILDDNKINGYEKMKDVMFLYRNNASALPIIDELYAHGINFRCSRFVKAYQIPIIKELYTLTLAARYPNNPTYVRNALLMLDEFKGMKYNGELPPIQAMTASKKSILELNYRWKENSSVRFIKLCQNASEAMKQGKMTGTVFNIFWPLFSEDIVKDEWWRYDNDPEFYTKLVAPILNSREFDKFVDIEDMKEAKEAACTAASVGIRCYTIHSAKGLEADYVYMLDIDEGYFPNKRTTKKKLDYGCEIDVAKDVRSERNLLFVAITRAKEKLVISYSGELSKLISNPEDNGYRRFDEIYLKNRDSLLGDDVGAFFDLFKIENGKDKE